MLEYEKLEGKIVAIIFQSRVKHLYLVNDLAQANILIIYKIGHNSKELIRGIKRNGKSKNEGGHVPHTGQGLRC